MLMNEHFIESEVEYQRQQRLAAAADYRRAKSAVRLHSWRSRLGGAVARRSHRRAAHAA